MDSAFLGIFPPPIAEILLPFVIMGIIGFLLCYAHRFLPFVVLPLYIALCIFAVHSLEFFTSLLSGYMLTVYLTMFLAIVAMLIGTCLSWKRYKSKFSKLK